MYFGESHSAVEYFASHGHYCPEHFNPSDFLLDILSPDNRSPEAEVESRNRIITLGDAWASKEMHEENLSCKLDFDPDMKIKSIGTKLTFYKLRKNFILLCWRSFTSQIRNVPAFAIKLTFAIVFSFIIGGIYSNIGYSQRSIQNRTGVLYFILINQAFNNVLAVLNSFPSEKTIVSRERGGRAYNTISYFCAKVVVELPLNLVPTIFYACICYL
jgi:hypothetical protein